MAPFLTEVPTAAGLALGGTGDTLATLLPRLAIAVALSCVLSLRPWRLLMKRPLPRAEMVQAQILLCVAASVVTVVIGDSVAKAFGLVGLGGFVRFRSGLKDPRDAALLFLLIGLGMACGHGALALAAAGTLCMGLLLLVLDWVGGVSDAEEPRRLAVSVATEDVAAAEQALRLAFAPRNVLIRRCALDFTGRRLELEVEEGRPGELGEALQAVRGVALSDVRWAALAPRASKEERA
jgi:uncharacterized membrane protein YhiD involved in acid resistance